ncbi:MAG: CDP-glucose 4,6-dehydratase [Rhodoferax sp.]|nr:CDP-glucose 4,6-dehydratase [Rhodoferax sp.]
MEDVVSGGPSADFWRGKTVLLTGHTGFKGAWLAFWLREWGARVTGLALPPVTRPSLHTLLGPDLVHDYHEVDIRDAAAVTAVVRAVRPDIVLHLAAQALVRASYREPVATLGTNIMGTAHVLDALRGVGETRVALMITTDKVYRNDGRSQPYREDDRLGGHDPYSASKAASELVIASYRDAYLSEQGVAVASARAGNVIGGGDWSEDRLIPDAVRAWQAGQTLQVRHPDAVRPWQHVLEPLAGYLTLAQALWHRPSGAGAYNFGPDTGSAASVQQVLELARKAYGSGIVCYQSDSNGPHEAHWLALDTGHTEAALGLRPRWSLQQALQHTMSWYRQQRQGADAAALCRADLQAFLAERSPA